MIINPFSKNDIKLIIRSFRYFKPYKLKSSMLFICMIVGIVLSLVQPIVWAKLLKSLFSKNFNQVVLLVTYITILFIVMSVVSLFQNYLIIFINNNIICDIRMDMYKSTLNLSMTTFNKMNVGDFISRINNDSQIIANVITNQIVGSIVDILKVIFIGITVFIISPILSLVIVLCFPISYLIFVYYGKKLKEKNGELVKSNDEYFNELHQSIVGIKEIYSLNAKSIKTNIFIDLCKNVKNKTVELGFISVFSQILSQIPNILSEILVTLIGAFMVINNNISIVYFIAFSSYSNQFSSSLLNVTKINSNFQQILKSLKRVFELIDNLTYSKQKFGTKHLDYIDGLINFQNVCFEYKKGYPILNNVSFNIFKNKITAIVGISGVGKSTILNLMLNFYDVNKGAIKIDGIDINDLNEQTLRSNISIVHQEPYFFNISIKENLLLVNPIATDDEIKKACLKAYLYEFIENLPEKYNTIIGENGVNLSGGQKQRLAIARVLLKGSKIILFDEATSALDNKSQEYINKSIKSISSNHTVVIVVHSLLSLKYADEIIIIDEGKIVGQGSHGELSNKNQAYKNLYNIN